MEETKQTNQNEEFNFGASKEIQDLILKTDNKILLSLIYQVFYSLSYEKHIYYHGSDKLKIFENYVLGNFDEIKKLEKEIEQRKQSLGKDSRQNLLKKYIETGDREKLKEANALNNKEEQPTKELEEDLKKVKEYYDTLSEVFSNIINKFYNKKFVQIKLDLKGISIITEFGRTKITIHEDNCGDHFEEQLKCLDFQEWKDIPFNKVIDTNYNRSLRDVLDVSKFVEVNKFVEDEINQLKENIRLQQAKNVSQTSNPRSAR